ncbi:AAA family ATPase [Streptomyces sp. NPDC002004]
MEGSSYASQKLWASMDSFEPDTYVRRIEFLGMEAYAGVDLTLAPFTLISGTHGSGKSTILSLVAEGVAPGSRTYSDQPPFVGISPYSQAVGRLGGKLRSTISNRGTTRVSEVDLDSAELGGDGAAVAYMETPYSIASDIQIFFQDGRDLRPSDEESFSAPEERQKPRDLKALRGILGFEYDELAYRPVNDSVSSGIVNHFPFVYGRRGGVWHDSYTMSYGELVVHLLRWRAKHLNGGRYVWLLDEPEAHVSPRGRAEFLDELARLARAAKLQVVMATHSPEFITRVPLKAVRVCLRTGSGRVIFTPERHSDLRDTLGISHPLKNVVVVEDEMARSSLGLILSAHGYSSLPETEFIEAGSWSDVLVTRRALETSRRLRSVAVVDGDQRSNLARREDSVLFLPGEGPPEKVFIEYAVRSPQRFAQNLGCSVHSMNIYTSELLGVDHHRWISLLAFRTGRDEQHCLRAAFEIWHDDDVNRCEAESLCVQIQEALGQG